jgi:hypothetical protein
MTPRKGAANCIYSATCRDCPGVGACYAVYLRSGRVIHVGDASNVRLEADCLVITRTGEPPLVFRRKDVYYAGCDRASPPFLS